MTSRIRALVVAAILILGPIAGASAEDNKAEDNRAVDDPVALGVGTAFRLFVGKAFARVIVGDPAVVDIRVDDDRSVVIEPLSPGETNLVFIDGRGVVTANVRISVCGAPPSKGCTAGQSS